LTEILQLLILVFERCDQIGKSQKLPHLLVHHVVWSISSIQLFFLLVGVLKGVWYCNSNFLNGNLCIVYVVFEIFSI